MCFATLSELGLGGHCFNLPAFQKRLQEDPGGRAGGREDQPRGAAQPDETHGGGGRVEPAALAVRELMDGFRYQADDVQDGEHGALARGQWDSMEQSVGLLHRDSQVTLVTLVMLVTLVILGTLVTCWTSGHGADSPDGLVLPSGLHHHCSGNTGNIGNTCTCLPHHRAGNTGNTSTGDPTVTLVTLVTGDSK